MDLSLSPNDDAFRRQLLAFIRECYPPEIRANTPYTDLIERQRPLWHGVLRYPARVRNALSRR